jgi:hypothetical protein
VTSEDDARQQALSAKGIDLLTEDLARADAELLGFSHWATPIISPGV